MKRKKQSPRLSRRGFLGATLAGASLAAFDTPGFMGRLANAQALPDVPDRYYVFCYFSGGWDVLLSLDPRDPAIFTNDSGSLARTRIQPAYDRVEKANANLVRTTNGMTFGPYIGRLTEHADRLAVVRGLNMETVAHTTGRRRFLTGKAPSGSLARGSSGATWLAGTLGEEHLIPHLSLNVEAYNRDMPNYATAMRVSNVNDLLRVLRPSMPALSRRVASQVNATLGATAECPSGRASAAWITSEDARTAAQNLVEQDVAGLFDLGARNNSATQNLRAHFGLTNANNSPQLSAAFAAQALTQGLSRCVSVNMVGGLDSHFDPGWADDHGPRQEAGFDGVALLAHYLDSIPYVPPHDPAKGNDGTSWLDHTVIMGFSEFSRTPLLNARGGRDHHITNSCFLLGGSVRGGQVIGASTDVDMQSQNINLTTGRPAGPNEDGEIIRPEHVLRTLFDEVGIGDAPDLRVNGLPTLLRS